MSLLIAASMAPAQFLLKLAAVLCAVLVQVSAGCDHCYSQTCVRFLGCTDCVPDLGCLAGPQRQPVLTEIERVNKQIEEARKRMEAGGAQVDKAQSCIESVSSCALDQLKQFLPELDTQFCDSTYKQRFEDGGGGPMWSAYYGPRIWDSEAVATLVGLFFPGPSAVAAANLVRDA